MLAISACIAILRLALRPLASAIIYEMAAGPGIVLSVIPRISGQQGSSAQPAVSASGSVPLGPIRPEDFGAAGDGVADDRDAIKQAIRYASETGRTLHIPAKTYRTSSGFRILHPIHIWCESGATILTTGTVDTAQQGFKIESSLRATLDFSARISSSNDSFTINDAAALAVGQEVMLWLGTDPYDPTQEYLRMWNVVKGIDGTTVTFDVPVPEDISGTEHKVAIFTSIAQNITIDGCRFSYAGPGDFDQWIMIINARNVTLQNIYGDLVAGSINIQESEGVVVDGLYVKEAIYRTSYGGSGSTLTGWGMRGCSARNIYIDQAGKSPVYLESQSRDFRIQNLHIQMVDNGLTFNPGVTVIGNSTATLTDYYFSAPVNSSTAFPPYLEADTSRLAVENLTVYSLSDNSSYSLWPVTGTLNLNGQRYTFQKRYTTTIALTPNMRGAGGELPDGIYVEVKTYFSSKTGLRATYFGSCRPSAYADVTSEVLPGTWQWLRPLNYHGRTNYPFSRCPEGKRVYWFSGASVPDGAFAVIDILYYPFPPEGGW